MYTNFVPGLIVKIFKVMNLILRKSGKYGPILENEAVIIVTTLCIIQFSETFKPDLSKNLFILEHKRHIFNFTFVN